MSDHTNFLNIVDGSEAVRERWAALVKRTVTEAAQHGVQLEADDVLNLRSARIAALGAPLDEDEYAAELLNLPALSTAARKKQIAEGDEEARAAAVADLNRGKDVHHSHRTAHAARTLSEARELGIATPLPEQDERSRNERLEALKDIKDPAERLSLARRWGLIE
ncbi:hypothetical protein SAMN05421853_11094 [Roseivivax halotolerans]|uniref:Uncharacterized protein n=1 Tax=Roseivivax halotolerans TaxID=93684 RepID=A0A1I5ZJ82_9RHOB|nr:hypothetical protein [Roseivivax halotolerans]SFQ56511.1 hypothetical protein SAMN05421853_11094 [Roseivivax halotolerans]